MIYHRQENNVNVPLEPIRGSLTQYRESLRNALERRLKACDIANLTSEETEWLADEYGRYSRLLDDND